MPIYLGSTPLKMEGAPAVKEVYLGATLVWQNAVWMPMTSYAAIPVTTTNATRDDWYLWEQSTATGTAGQTKTTWEELYVNGVTTGQKRNIQTVTTVAMVSTVVTVGTKNTIQLINVLDNNYKEDLILYHEYRWEVTRPSGMPANMVLVSKTSPDTFTNTKIQSSPITGWTGGAKISLYLTYQGSATPSSLPVTLTFAMP